MPVTKYVWDVITDTYLMETDENDATTAVYTNEPGQFGPVISQRRGANSHFFHQDGLGSVVDVTDAAEDPTDSYVYKGYGEILAATGSTTNPFRWVGSLGYYYDIDLLQYYIRARHYNPVLARWLSPDPIGFVADDNNVQRYVFNSPASFVDPHGTGADEPQARLYWAMYVNDPELTPDRVSFRIGMVYRNATGLSWHQLVWTRTSYWNSLRKDPFLTVESKNEDLQFLGKQGDNSVTDSIAEGGGGAASALADFRAQPDICQFVLEKTAEWGLYSRVRIDTFDQIGVEFTQEIATQPGYHGMVAKWLRSTRGGVPTRWIYMRTRTELGPNSPMSQIKAVHPQGNAKLTGKWTYRSVLWRDGIGGTVLQWVADLWFSPAYPTAGQLRRSERGTFTL